MSFCMFRAEARSCSIVGSVNESVRPESRVPASKRSSRIDRELDLFGCQNAFDSRFLYAETSKPLGFSTGGLTV